MIYRFTLTHSGTSTVVAEPRGWIDFKSEIKRDFKSHGVVFKYTSSVLKLGFADGRDILENAFQLGGYDSVVELAIDERPDEYTSYTNVFTGNARMESRNLEEDYFECDFESSTFQQKVVNRLKTNIKTDSLIDLDGESLVGSLTSYTNTWPTIRLFRTYSAVLFGSSFYSGSIAQTTSVTATKNTNGYIGFGVINIETLESVNLTKNEVTTIDGVFDKDVTPALFIFDIDGPANVSGELDRTDNQEVSALVALNSDITYTTVYKILQYREASLISSKTIDTETDTHLNVTAIFDDITFDNTIVFDEDFTVLAGDELYLIYENEVTLSAPPSYTYTTINKMSGQGETFIIINLLTESTNESVKFWLIHDVFERAAYTISGKSDCFYSEFFGLTEHGYATDGCGGLNAITNGTQFRTIDNALNMSMEDLLSWASARYGIGWGFEKTYDGSYRIRVEPMEHFYQDGQILDLGDPLPIKQKGSYKESSFDPLLINKFEIGYSKFNKEIAILNNFEDFLTKSEYSLPISSVDGTYTKVSKFICSNDIIQATFEAKKNLGKSWKYDEDNFIIALRRDASNFLPENNENFESTTGLDDEGTAYNIRHAPVFMELEHALLINSSLMGKPLDKLIQNTSAKINLNFSARFNSYETCLLGDSQRLLRSSAGNIEIGDNYEGLRLWNPIIHELRVALTCDQFNTIIDAMENNSIDSDKNLGYLTYRNNEGQIKNGYIINGGVIWNPNDGIADIKTLERADNYVL